MAPNQALARRHHRLHRRRRPPLAALYRAVRTGVPRTAAAGVTAGGATRTPASWLDAATSWRMQLGTQAPPACAATVLGRHRTAATRGQPPQRVAGLPIPPRQQQWQQQWIPEGESVNHGPGRRADDIHIYTCQPVVAYDTYSCSVDVIMNAGGNAAQHGLLKHCSSAHHPPPEQQQWHSRCWCSNFMRGRVMRMRC